MSAQYYTRLYEDFQRGAALSNTDLFNLESHFRRVGEDLWMCGPVFRLAAIEASRVADRCREYITARGLKVQ